jgi:flagellar motor switch protein FliN/FliY
MSETTENTGGAADDWASALQEQADAESGGGQGEVAKAELPDLVAEGRGPTMEDTSLDVILDIPVSISMEVGQTSISIRNLLQLNQGSVVELDRLAGEPLDVKVNGTLIAHGEVVVVNEKFGIRLTDVISPSERIKKLK